MPLHCIYSIITFFLALIVISIRLGFLVIKFSSGIILDFINCCIDSILGENYYNKHDKRKEKKNKPHYCLAMYTQPYGRRASMKHQNSHYFPIFMLISKKKKMR